LFHAPLEFMPRQEHAVAALHALDAYIGANTGYLPIKRPARMRLS